ncbi:MAG: ribose-5-phosphate isomerase [Bifidobacteriaceae bacterium]|jgi:ribose 5-phosphate isomerase B|nr:ribose-5-phosphate isomerase [Bifidobacteriaceae bacterium]
MSPAPLSIAIGCDDAGTDYKAALGAHLAARGHKVVDVGVAPGAHTPYPDIAAAAARGVAAGTADRALLICGTGLGMAIAANKVLGVRAVTAHDVYSVERSILSNNAQVLCLGARSVGLELARRLLDAWLAVRFDPASPSAAKVARIAALEGALAGGSGRT